MPWKPTSHAELQRAADPAARGRAFADRQYGQRRLDDPVQAQAEEIRHSARWRKLRAVVLSREPLCRVCLAHGVTTAALDVDHATALVDLLRDGQRELAFDIDNLQPLCRADHNQKTAREKVERRASCKDAQQDATPNAF